MTRCPSCDAPLATMADIRPDDTPRPEDDLLCWRAFHGDECQREPIDWRARALAAEARSADVAQDLDAADRAASTYQCQLLEAQDAYEDAADVLREVAAERDRAQADAEELATLLDGLETDVREFLPAYALDPDGDEANPREQVEYAGAEIRRLRSAMSTIASLLDTADSPLAVTAAAHALQSELVAWRGPGRDAYDRALDACAARIQEVLDERDGVRLVADAHANAASRIEDDICALAVASVARAHALRGIADRITALTLSPHAGQLWPELCRLDSDLRALISDEKAVAGDGENAQSGTEGVE